MPKIKSAKGTGLHYSSWQMIQDMWHMIAGHRWRFFFATLARLLSDLAGLLPIYTFAEITNFFVRYQAGDSLTYVWWMMVVFTIAIIVRATGKFTAKSWGYKIAESVGIETTIRAVNHLFLLDMAWHERENAGNKIKRIQNASEAINRILRLWFDCVVEIIVNVVAINVILGSFDIVVTLLIVLFLVVYFVFARILTRKAAQASYEVNAEEENVAGLVYESINNIKTVKVMSMRAPLLNMITAAGTKLFAKIRVKILSYQARNSSLSALAGLTKAGIMIVIIHGVVQGAYELGFLVLFNSYFTSINGSIEDLANVTQDFVSGKFSAARLKKIMDEPITIDSETNKYHFPKNWQTISFKKVSFSYGENKVLKNISFEVKRGEKVGIVGLSGAGKSTIFKLLLKERDQFSGDILIDNISLKDISKQSYFQHVSVVLQDTEVFNFPLKDNITITNTHKRTNAKLFKQALEIAHITDLVKKLPEGLNTIIGEKGVKLSGGERQRLGIARAIFKQPEILLLDEATSHLDLESEEKIRDSLHAFFENVTAIVIAHRLTTIREMDKILVIEDGKLIESGSFAALQKLRGRFFELWKKQGL